MKEKKSIQFAWTLEALVVLIAGLVLLFVIGKIVYAELTKPIAILPANVTLSAIITPPANVTLSSILKYEIDNPELLGINRTDWVCFDYAEYFNKTLSEKYPELDIRWIRHMDICNQLSLCSDYHTYLMIGGYGQLCMLNSRIYKCEDFRESLNMTT